MKRWNNRANDRTENKKIDAFLAEVIEVCKKHGMSISHEDAHGAFIVEPFDEASVKWLMDAQDGTQ